MFILKENVARPDFLMNEPAARNLFALLCALAALAIAGGALLEIARFRRARRENAAAFSGDATTQNAPATQIAPGAASTRAVPIALVSPRQSKLRLLAAALWIFVLALLAYSVTAWWPQPGNLPEARRFATAIGAALLLVCAALSLLIYDVIQIARARTLQAAQSSAEFAAMLREEAAKLREEQKER